MSEEEKEVVKISIPLITEDEIIKIDNNLDDIINQFTQQFVHNKDLAIAQHIIQKQQTEIERKDKIIDNMAKELYISGYCANIQCKKCKAENFANCIKQYFERKVEE